MQNEKIEPLRKWIEATRKDIKELNDKINNGEAIEEEIDIDLETLEDETNDLETQIDETQNELTECKNDFEYMEKVTEPFADMEIENLREQLLLDDVLEIFSEKDYSKLEHLIEYYKML